MLNIYFAIFMIISPFKIISRLHLNFIAKSTPNAKQSQTLATLPKTQNFLTFGN